MSNDIRIERQIKRILSPNFKTTILDYNNFSTKRQYESIISCLCQFALKCLVKKIHTPHIQIKDDVGNLLYNDLLNIIAPKEKSILPSSKCHFQADFIDDGLRGNAIYGMFTPLEPSGRKLLTFGTFELEKPMNEMELFDCMNLMKCMLENEEKKSNMPPIENQENGTIWAVSYTHLTLPTIYSV